MIPMPDLSYFAVPGFIPRLRQHYADIWSSSLLLHNRELDQWDNALSEQSPQLTVWLHNRTARIHNIYLSYTPNINFLHSNYLHIRKIIEPAKERIRVFLIELGIEDVDTYLEDSHEWLSILFCSKKQAHRSAEIAARKFGINSSELPAIVIWASFDSSCVVVIKPNQSDTNILEYIKSIYWSVVTTTENMASKHERIRIDKLEKKIKDTLNKSHYIKKYEDKIRDIATITLNQPVYRILTSVADEYSSSFEDSILNFEEEIKDNFNSLKNFSILKFSQASKSKIVRKLQGEGFIKIREGSEHEIWKHPQLQKTTSLPRHTKISPFVVKSIERDIVAARLSFS